MEKLEALRKRLVKVDLSKVMLVKKYSKNTVDGSYNDCIETCYLIKHGKLPVGKVYTWTYPGGLKYLSLIEINPIFRRFGIGRFILQKYFRGYFLIAGNNRVKSLYNKIGRPVDKFKKKEAIDMLKTFTAENTPYRLK